MERDRPAFPLDVEGLTPCGMDRALAGSKEHPRSEGGKFAPPAPFSVTQRYRLLATVSAAMEKRTYPVPCALASRSTRAKSCFPIGMALWATACLSRVSGATQRRTASRHHEIRAIERAHDASRLQAVVGCPGVWGAAGRAPPREEALFSLSADRFLVGDDRRKQPDFGESSSQLTCGRSQRPPRMTKNVRARARAGAH